MSLSVIVRQHQAGWQDKAVTSPHPRQSRLHGGRFATFGILHFIYILNVSQAGSLSLCLADICNLPLQINFQVMAVTSPLPVSLPASALCRFVSACQSVDIPDSMQTPHSVGLFYAQFMLICPQFSHKGSSYNPSPPTQHIFMAFVDIYARFFSHWAEIV